MKVLIRRFAPYLSTIVLLFGPGGCKFADSDAPGAIRMLAWPSYVSARTKGYVQVEVALENTTRSDKFARPWTYPLPGGGCLLIRCKDLGSGADIPYIRFPIPLEVGTMSGVLNTDRIPAGDFCGQTVDMSQFFNLKPGNYSLTLWADTTGRPWWATRTFPVEWVGITNKVTITVHITN